jgi:tRNA (adenine37-N6)-methyltransferase
VVDQDALTGYKHMKYTLFCSLAVLALSLIGAGNVAVQGEPELSLHVIGRVKKEAGKTEIVLKKKYQPALQGLEDFSHVYVLYWLDRNDTPEKRATLKVHPRGNRHNPLTGVFATRSPLRPNLIALSLSEIVTVRENVLEVRDLDALPDSPVLDLKPYLPERNLENLRIPAWAR